MLRMVPSPSRGGSWSEAPHPRLRLRLFEQFRHRPDHGVGAVGGVAGALVAGIGEAAELVLELGETAGEAGAAGFEVEGDRLGAGGFALGCGDEADGEAEAYPFWSSAVRPVNTVVFARGNGIVRNEPSVVALEDADYRGVLMEA